MGSLGGWEYLFGPAVSFVVVGVLVLLLRWAFGRGRSLVEKRSTSGTPQEYGLLVRVAAPAWPRSTAAIGNWRSPASASADDW